MSTTHWCEFDLPDCTSSDCDIVEECGSPASVKRQGRWYCEEHSDYVERHCSAHLKEKS